MIITSKNGVEEENVKYYPLWRRRYLGELRAASASEVVLVTVFIVLK